MLTPGTAIAPVFHLAQTLSRDWSLGLQIEASSYMAAHRLTPAIMLRVDVVLMLLRIDTEEARRRAQELSGRVIHRCPPSVPPWPPKPVARSPRGPVIAACVPNPCSTGTSMHDRYKQVMPGRSREQLLARGVTVRDLAYWQKKGHITFTNGGAS